MDYKNKLDEQPDPRENVFKRKGKFLAKVLLISSFPVYYAYSQTHDLGLTLFIATLGLFLTLLKDTQDKKKRKLTQ